MSTTAPAAAEQRQVDAAGPSQLLTPADVAREYTIPESTQAVWRSTNRYNFRDLVIKLGHGIRYRRRDVEAWLDSRRESAMVGGKPGVA